MVLWLSGKNPTGRAPGTTLKKENNMKELGMKWNQIFVGEDKTATDTYGIAGIPHIILFAPDGTILKRNLRGTEMFNAVVEVME